MAQLLSMKLTTPVGVPVFGATAGTSAVQVTDPWRNRAGLSAQPSVVAVPPVIYLLVTKPMVMVETSPGATVTVEVWAALLQGPCWPAGMVLQPTMAVPGVGCCRTPKSAEMWTDDG